MMEHTTRSQKVRKFQIHKPDYSIVDKQVNDKERVLAAMENPDTTKAIDELIEESY